MNDAQNQHVFGEDNLQNLADNIGQATQSTTSLLAPVLPVVIDQVSLHSEAAANNDLLSQGLTC